MWKGLGRKRDDGRAAVEGGGDEEAEKATAEGVEVGEEVVEEAGDKSHQHRN